MRKHNLNNQVIAGQYHDWESGLHYNWHRYYRTGLGRYITADPIGLAGGINPYSYAYQNPLKYVDRDGLKINCWWWGCKGDAELPPTDRKEPKKPIKPKRPKCVDSTTNFSACISCCTTVKGNLASKGGTVCHEECARLPGYTKNDDSRLCES